jgi:Uma2 family endonuclease
VEVAMSVQLLRRKFTVEQYHKMAEAGILTQDDKVELIRGEVLEMQSVSTKHTTCVRRVSNLLSRHLGDKVLVSIHNPVELNSTSEVQPDVALLKPSEDFYETAHPQPRDVFLLVEVVDSTVKYDREVKIPVYAEDSITEVWLVDLEEEFIEVYRDPSAYGYQNIQKFTREQSLSTQTFRHVSFAVDEILGE